MGASILSEFERNEVPTGISLAPVLKKVLMNKKAQTIADFHLQPHHRIALIVRTAVPTGPKSVVGAFPEPGLNLSLSH
jgi:hypothetical protein